jgi:hypothetical protein
MPKINVVAHVVDDSEALPPYPADNFEARDASTSGLHIRIVEVSPLSILRIDCWKSMVWMSIPPKHQSPDARLQLSKKMRILITAHALNRCLALKSSAKHDCASNRQTFDCEFESAGIESSRPLRRFVDPSIDFDSLTHRCPSIVYKDRSLVGNALLKPHSCVRQRL